MSLLHNRFRERRNAVFWCVSVLTALAKHDSIAAFYDTGRAMAHHFREPERRQALLLPADMMDWLPEGDIVHLIVDAVALMDLGEFEADYKLGRAGQAPFAPQVLLALLIYAYSHGVRSSRVIERLCGRDAGYRFIVGDTVPDHTVIARFRQRHVGRMLAWCTDQRCERIDPNPACGQAVRT